MRKRLCKGRYYKAGGYHDFQVGQFHQWGSSYEEFENGAGNYSVAIVELPDGTVVMPVADDICFLEDEAINKLIEECACNENLVFTMAGARDILNRYRDHVCMMMVGTTGAEESKMMYSLFNALKMGENALDKLIKQREGADEEKTGKQ